MSPRGPSPDAVARRRFPFVIFCAIPHIPPMPPPIDLEAAFLGPLVAGRTCGDCTICCTVLRIDTAELDKPAGTPCVHTSGLGCAIHATRPQLCRAWFCGWRRLATMPAAARPDRSGLLVSLDYEKSPRNCLEGVAIVVRSLTGRAAFEGRLAEDLLDTLCGQLVPVWLHDGAQKVLVHPDGEIAAFIFSGEPPPPDLRDEVAAWRSRYAMFG